MSKARAEIVETLYPKKPPKLDEWIVAVWSGCWVCGGLLDEEMARFIYNKRRDEGKFVRLIHIVENPTEESNERRCTIVRNSSRANEICKRLTHTSKDIALLVDYLYRADKLAKAVSWAEHYRNTKDDSAATAQWSNVVKALHDYQGDDDA